MKKQPPTVIERADLMVDEWVANPLRANELTEFFRRHLYAQQANSGLRPAVLMFAESMEHRLRDNDHKKDLPRPNMIVCFDRMAKIVKELKDASESAAFGATPTRREMFTKEKFRLAADLANWLAMLLELDVNQIGD